MPEYRITMLLRTDAAEREVERLAAELAEDARSHLRDGEHLELEGVAPAPAQPERRSAGA